MCFYDDLAGSYDDLVGQASRRPAGDVFAALFVERYGAGRVADVGCGTGLYALALAKVGAQVVGLDPSEAMLDQARSAAKREGLEVPMLKGGLADLPELLVDPQDAVVCMGNAMPHIRTLGELRDSLVGARAVLAPGGVMVVQWLNYPRLIASGRRVVAIERSGNTEYVRFYDSLGGQRLRFNVLTINWSDAGCAHELASTELNGWDFEQVAEALREVGLVGIEAFGSTAFEPFDPAGSETVMLVARAPEA